MKIRRSIEKAVHAGGDLTGGRVAFESHVASCYLNERALMLQNDPDTCKHGNQSSKVDQLTELGRLQGQACQHFRPRVNILLATLTFMDEELVHIHRISVARVPLAIRSAR